jgi:hypothetical protein
MPFDYVVSAFLSLFVVRIIAGIILAGSTLIGDWLLETLQISLAAFRIAGGLLLFSIASEMVFGVRIRRERRSRRAGGRRACTQCRRFSARDSASGWSWRHHGNGFACRARSWQLADDCEPLGRGRTGGRVLRRPFSPNGSAGFLA